MLKPRALWGELEGSDHVRASSLWGEIEVGVARNFYGQVGGSGYAGCNISGEVILED